jgi:hypothetical protein
MSRTHHARPARKARLCSVCGGAGHSLPNCPDRLAVAGVRLGQVIFAIDPEAWPYDRDAFYDARERLSLAEDVIRLDPALASATLDDVIDRWPRVRQRVTGSPSFPLAPAWLRIVELANDSLAARIRIDDERLAAG